MTLWKEAESPQSSFPVQGSGKAGLHTKRGAGGRHPGRGEGPGEGVGFQSRLQAAGLLRAGGWGEEGQPTLSVSSHMYPNGSF